MSRATDGLLCPAGCSPCGPVYWRSGRHYGDCCGSRLCGTAEQARATEAYIRKERERGSSVRTTGALKTFVEAEAKKTDPLKAWLGVSFEDDVRAWLQAEAGYANLVDRWLYAENTFKRAMAKWLAAEQQWQADVRAWLEVETTWEQAAAEVEQYDAAVAEWLAAEQEFIASLLAKADAIKASRVVHLVRDEAAPVRRHVNPAHRVRRAH